MVLPTLLRLTLVQLRLPTVEVILMLLNIPAVVLRNGAGTVAGVKREFRWSVLDFRFM